MVTLVLSVPALAAENVSFGGSLEFGGIYLFKDNQFSETMPVKVQQDVSGTDVHFAQSEIYLWATADLADNVMAKISIKYRNEFGRTSYDFFNEDTRHKGNLVLNEGFVKLGKIFDSQMSAQIGRFVNQKANDVEMTMAGNRNKLVPLYGEGFILPNTSPVDGVKLTYDADKFTVDALWYKLLKDRDFTSADDTLWGLYAQFKGIENQKFDAYALYIDNGSYSYWPFIDIWGYEFQTFVIGGRAEGAITPVDGLKYKAELAYTKVHVSEAGWSDNNPNGFGGYAGIAYTFNNLQYKPSARLNLYYLSKGFIQPFGHVDQTHVGEQGYGQIVDHNSQLAYLTDAWYPGVYFVNAGVTIKTSDKWAVDADYYHYNLAYGNSVLGHEIDLRLSYQYSENVAAELIGGYFMAPGNPTGSYVAADWLCLPGDAFLIQGGIKVTF